MNVRRMVDVHVVRATDSGAIETLLLRRSPDRAFAGQRRMVAGKVQLGERAWAAAVRELREETGIVPSRLFALPVPIALYDWERDARESIVPFGAIVDTPIEPLLDDEHDDWTWVSLDEALRRLAWPTQRQGLEVAAELARDPSPFASLEIPRARWPTGEEPLP